MATNIFQTVFVKVDSATTTYITDTATEIISFATPLFTSMLILWIAIWGYLMIYGRAQDTLRDGFFRILRVGAIITCGLTIGTYMSVVVDFLQKGPEYIASLVSSGPAASVPVSLDALFDKVYVIAKAAWLQGGVMNGNFGLYLIAVIILVVGSIFVLYIAFLVLLAKLMVVCLLAVGPLFIISLLFSTTQKYFESWIAAISNYGILLILASSVGALVLSLASSYVNAMLPANESGSSLANLYDSSMLCLMFGLCGLVVKQVPMVAASLGGGFALAAQGAISSAIEASRPTRLRRQAMRLKRDVQIAKSAATAPIRQLGSASRAFQKNYTGNSVQRQ